MYKTKYFTMAEMTYSNTARLNKIDNTPTPEHEENLKELMEKLDDIREKWGGPIKITSGYRSTILNTKVGGSKSSAHQFGWAADIKPFTNNMPEFEEFMEKWAMEDENMFDQLIFERDTKGNRWVHLGIYSPKGKQRREVKTLLKKE